MKIDANALALSAAVTTALLWLLCSLFVVMMPGMSMNMSGYMMHSDFSGMQWELNIIGFLAGLIIWSLCAAVTAWLLATFYNRFSA